MNSKQVKVIRGQIRQVVKEILGEVITQEFVAQLDKDLRANQKERLDLVFEMVKGTLERIDSRQKEIQNMIVREMMQGPNTPIDPAIAPIGDLPKAD